MKIGDKIKELREGKNISQKELAETIGVSDAMVSMYENNKKGPSLTTVAKIADALNVTTDYLLEIETISENDMPENIRAVARDLMELPEKDKKLAIDMIKMMSQRGKEAKEK